jgi:SAM-dependent methyltransferase
MKRIDTLHRMASYLMRAQPWEAVCARLEQAPTLTVKHLSGAKLYPTRVDMLSLLPRGSRCAEVGTLFGEFSHLIAKLTQPAEFHLFDLDFAPLREECIRDAFDGEIHKHQGDSSVNLARFPADYFDWIYIDGLHTYDGVVRDLTAAHTVLKRGGYLMCNDYTNWDPVGSQAFGVAKAVNELCLRHDYAVAGLALDGLGFHDILIRKPD